MDIEWLLSTLFDASLLSPSSRRQRRLFFVPFLANPENRRHPGLPATPAGKPETIAERQCGFDCRLL